LAAYYHHFQEGDVWPTYPNFWNRRLGEKDGFCGTPVVIIMEQHVSPCIDGPEMMFAVAESILPTGKVWGWDGMGKTSDLGE
jgi:hypothetical protein